MKIKPVNQPFTVRVKDQTGATVNSVTWSVEGHGLTDDPNTLELVSTVNGVATFQGTTPGWFIVTATHTMTSAQVSVFVNIVSDEGQIKEIEEQLSEVTLVLGARLRGNRPFVLGGGDSLG